MSSTMKTPRHLKLGKKLPIGEGAAAGAADAAAADVVGGAARVVPAAEAAAPVGAVAAGAKRFQAEGSLELIGRLRSARRARCRS